MKAKKRLAGEVLGVSPGKVKFSEDALEDIQKAITRADIRGLIAVRKISIRRVNQHSRSGARSNAAQKRKGRQKGKGSRKGSKHSIVTAKENWMNRIRLLRAFLKELKLKKLLSAQDYRSLYAKCSGGYFRNKRHLKLYLTEHQLIGAESAR